tara:strand:+ start:431 stop:958 length:528 start_codon:yes stop_codon:yes gene_type:complete
MTTNYPTSQDSFSRPTASSALTGHAALHDDISDAVESIEQVVGITGGTSGALLFQKAVLTGTISAATGVMTMAITSDPHNLFDTASSNQVEANFNGFMFTRPTNQTDTNAEVFFRDRDDYAQMFPYTASANAFSTFGTQWYGQSWNVRDTAHFDFLASNVQTNTITLECFAFLTY